ncbi:MAG: hypothetical protein WBV94_25225 [Blastocatellia bacterium]
MIEMDVKGIDELLRDLSAAGERAISGLERTLYPGAEKVMAKSKRLCPALSGALRASGHVERPVRSGAGVEIKLGYGNSSVGYAEIVHERMDVEHASPTQAKFLEQPMIEALPEIEAAVAEEMKRAFG